MEKHETNSRFRLYICALVSSCYVFTALFELLRFDVREERAVCPSPNVRDNRTNTGRKVCGGGRLQQ